VLLALDLQLLSGGGTFFIGLKDKLGRKGVSSQRVSNMPAFRSEEKLCLLKSPAGTVLKRGRFERSRSFAARFRGQNRRGN
jgi:hypothetical protein